MKDILHYIISSIVEFPEKVSIDQVEENEGVSFTISIAQEDMGKVIGKNGRMIRAIRNVMKIPAIKQGKRININLTENAA